MLVFGSLGDTAHHEYCLGKKKPQTLERLGGLGLASPCKGFISMKSSKINTRITFLSLFSTSATSQSLL